MQPHFSQQVHDADAADRAHKFLMQSVAEPAAPVPVAVPAAPEEKSSYFAGAGVVVATFAIAALVGNMDRGRNASSNEPTKAAAPTQYVAPRSEPRVPEYPIPQQHADAYQRELKGLLSASPELDHRSPSFNPTKAAIFRNLLTEQLRSGRPPPVAARMAYVDYLRVERATTSPQEAADPPRRGAARVRREATREAVIPPPGPCAYKGVMSDDDYRACGVEPPRSH